MYFKISTHAVLRTATSLLPSSVPQPRKFQSTPYYVRRRFSQSFMRLSALYFNPRRTTYGDNGLLTKRTTNTDFNPRRTTYGDASKF